MGKIIGIYKITSPTGKIYIGQSRDIIRRFRKYRCLNCKHQPKLYSSLKKHGYDKHLIEIIETCEIEQLNEKEVHYIALFKTFDTKNGMNLVSGGGASRRTSEETKQRLRIINTGKKASAETREKISQKMKGNSYALGMKHTEAHKLFISRLHTGRVVSEETRRKHSIASKGKIASEETRRKIGLKSKGRCPTAETRKKISEAGKGRITSLETRAKIGLGSFGKTQNKPNKLSKYTGVSVSKPTEKRRVTRYISRITIGGKSKHIGIYKTEIEAAKAYDRFVILNIPFTIPLNFPDEDYLERLMA